MILSPSVSLVVSSLALEDLGDLMEPDDLSMCPCRDLLEGGEVAEAVWVLDFRFLGFDSDGEDEGFVEFGRFDLEDLDCGFCVVLVSLESLGSKSSRCDCLVLLLVVAGMVLVWCGREPVLQGCC